MADRNDRGQYARPINPKLREDLEKAEVNQEARPLPEDPELRDAVLNQAASLVLEWLGGLEPQWKERIEVAQIERHWNKLQCLAQLAAYTLDQNAHLVAPPHPAFEQGYIPAGSETVCPNCGNAFKLRYPGQPFCGNACANQARMHEQQTLNVPLTGTDQLGPPRPVPLPVETKQ